MAKTPGYNNNSNNNNGTLNSTLAHSCVTRAQYVQNLAI